MKVIMYMAISVNGMIAKSDDNTSWISANEWNSYSAAIRKAGNLIVGRRTYNILTKQPEFSELKDVKLVAVSEKGFQPSDPSQLVARSPREALDLLRDFEEIMVAGGGILNATFLSQDLVDELYIDIEPIVLGQGVQLFNGRDFESRLELIGQKSITHNEVQLHYKVLKQK